MLTIDVKRVLNLDIYQLDFYMLIGIIGTCTLGGTFLDDQEFLIHHAFHIHAE